ncbi:MAG: aminotransferase class IV [Candidatus Devosia symbiotica]|nr:aminotransferase class IV [Candidatus Devosia symbiotica]
MLTYGLHYPSSVFEGECAYGGQIFKSREHTERLILSAATLDMSMSWSVDQIEEAKRAVLEKNNLVDAYVRPIAWRGSEELSVPARNNTVHLAIVAWAWPSYFSVKEEAQGHSSGMEQVEALVARDRPVLGQGSWSLHDLHVEQGCGDDQRHADALMLDYRGYAAEATGTNVFFIKGKDITTPTSDCFLNGITRQTLIALAKQHDYTVTERHIMPEELDQFDECFLTGTAAEVTPVSEIGPDHFKPAEGCQTLIDAYT